MTAFTPAAMLAYTTEMADRLVQIKKKAVFVGLPNEKVGGKVYGDGMTVLRVGAIHEYGVPSRDIPQRSFLRAPFRIKRKELNEAVAKQFEAVLTGRRDVDVGLGRVGAVATNISKGAFTSLGYGEWTPINAETKRRKGSNQTLIDTGVLRNSISSVVRSA